MGWKHRRTLVLSLPVLLWITKVGLAQAPFSFHPLASTQNPPGSIGQLQLVRNELLRRYVQPIKIVSAEGTFVSVAEDGHLSPPEVSPVVVGMSVGSVYRLKVTNIPNRENQAVYPTIEVINRLHPPAGKKLQYPIPVEITLGELKLALDGKLVTRVVYLERPGRAFAGSDYGKSQRYFEVRPHEDPLTIADYYGRPMAILRMGSRQPSGADSEAAFCFAGSPLVRYAAEELIESSRDYDAQKSLEATGPRTAQPESPGGASIVFPADSTRTPKTQPIGVVEFVTELVSEGSAFAVP